MDHIESRNAPSPEAASDDFASLSHSRTGEAPDRLAFEPVPLRHRVDGLTPEKQRAYVEALADTGVAREAAGRVGVSEQSINRVRRRADARSFDHACEAAHVHGARRLRSVAYERAVEGTLKGHYYHGELISQERVYDNRLLIHLLGKTEHLLQPPGQALAICENWEAHMDALEQGAEPPEPEREDWRSAVWEERETGALRTCFPPPTGFSGDEEGVWDGVNWYSRSLTPEEQASLDVLEAAEMARDRATECARRDRFFGFAGDGISSSRQAEPYEASADEGPIEIKSMAGLRLRNPEDRRISGLSRPPGAGWDPGEKPRRAFHPPGPACAGTTRRSVIPAQAGTHEHAGSRLPPPESMDPGSSPGRRIHPIRPSPASLEMNHRESLGETRREEAGTAQDLRRGQGPARPPLPRQARIVGRRAGR